jgi:hypothetical protein
MRKTAMIELRDKLLEEVQNLKEASQTNEHLKGYREALKNVANDIDAQMAQIERNQFDNYQVGVVDDTWKLAKKPMQLDQMILKAKNNYKTNKYRSYKQCYEAGVDAMAELIRNENKSTTDY